MALRHPITMRLAATIGLVTCALLPAVKLGAGQTVRTERPWEGWHQQLADGVIGLRFGMDRFTVADILVERGFAARPGRGGTLRYEGKLLDEQVMAVLTFNDAANAGMGGRLHEIQLHWNLAGLPRVPLRLFERLDGMLESRYGVPLAVESAGRGALETGNGVERKFYEGPEARAVLELLSLRPERFDLVFRLESPQLEPLPSSDS